MTEPKRYTLLDRDERPARSTAPGTLGGHRRAKIYGRLDCPAALRAIARGGYVQHRLFFADEATAIAAGTVPAAPAFRKGTDNGRRADEHRGIGNTPPR